MASHPARTKSHRYTSLQLAPSPTRVEKQSSLPPVPPDAGQRRPGRWPAPVTVQNRRVACQGAVQYGVRVATGRQSAPCGNQITLQVTHKVIVQTRPSRGSILKLQLQILIGAPQPHTDRQANAQYCRQAKQYGPCRICRLRRMPTLFVTCVCLSITSLASFVGCVPGMGSLCSYSGIPTRRTQLQKRTCSIRSHLMHF